MHESHDGGGEAEGDPTVPSPTTPHDDEPAGATDLDDGGPPLEGYLAL
ncbi:MAG: hypothetical protein ACRD0N_04485 [Acidimicrobiales bacterium]